MPISSFHHFIILVVSIRSCMMLPLSLFLPSCGLIIFADLGAILLYTVHFLLNCLLPAEKEDTVYGFNSDWLGLCLIGGQSSGGNDFYALVVHPGLP